MNFDSHYFVEGSVLTAVEVLHVYSKVCTRRVATYAERCIKRGKESSDHWYFAPMRKTGGDGLLSQIFMGDKNWTHHFDPILKLQFTKWQPNDIPSKKIFKSVPSVGKKFCSLVLYKKMLFLWISCLTAWLQWTAAAVLKHKWLAFIEFVPQEKIRNVGPLQV